MGYEAFTNARDATLRNVEGSMAALESGRQAGVARRAGNALQSGDYGAASNALYQGGDLQGGLAVQNAGRERQTADRDQQRTALLAVATGLKVGASDVASRRAQLQAIAPRLSLYGVTPDMLQGITDEDLTDQGLDGVISMLGGTARGNAPSGYRYRPDGTLEAIPGGPEDPANQRPIVTPYGIMMPPGAPLPNMGGQGAPQGQPQTLGATIPPGWSAAPPRPNQPPSAPAAGGGERAQPVSVSFPSSRDAQAAISSLVPGVRVTSGARSPADNRRVGGAAGSFHLQDRARDLVPPAGMTMGQLAAKMRQAGFRALDEGDHVHVSW